MSPKPCAENCPPYRCFVLPPRLYVPMQQKKRVNGKSTAYGILNTESQYRTSGTLRTTRKTLPTHMGATSPPKKVEVAFILMGADYHPMRPRPFCLRAGLWKRNGVRRNVDRRLGAREQVGDELAGCGSLRQAEATVMAPGLCPAQGASDGCPCTKG